MKKMTIVAALAALSTSAFASKARMEALGQDDDRGSYFMMDSRNVFRNPSAVLQMDGHIVTEWGSSDNHSSAPGAEGGFFDEAGAFYYGVYLGRGKGILGIDGNSDGDFTDAGDSLFLSKNNRIDFFLAGEAGVQWGAQFYRRAAEQDVEAVLLDAQPAAKSKQDHNAMGMNAGVMLGDLSAYLNLGLSKEANGAFLGDHGSSAATAVKFNAKDKFEGEMNLALGGPYKMNDHTFYGEYRSWGLEATVDEKKHTFTQSTITLGMAQMMEMGEGSHWFWDVKLSMPSSERQVPGRDGRSV